MCNKEVHFLEIHICILLCCLGIFEAGHLMGLMFGLSVTSCGKIILAMLALFGVVGIILLVKYREVIGCRIKAKDAMFCFFVVLCLLQTFYICGESLLSTTGDITLETVNTFLTTDQIYTVSPLTGREYSGAPLRYKILCLPTVYTLLCKWFGITPQILVGRVIPVITLYTAYGAYYLLSGSLFGCQKENREKRFCFLVIVALIFFFCENAVYMEGYGVLHGGYLGTTIRNSILIPFLLYAVLGKRWFAVVLCLLAEVCIVWTFWGLGVCAAMLAGMLILGQVWRILSEKRCLFMGSTKEENDQ